MNSQFIDTHAHLYGDEFAEDLPDVIDRAIQAGAQHLFIPSTDLPSAIKAKKLWEIYPGLCYPMIGLHPEDIPSNSKEMLEPMEEILKHPHPYIGIGEVGLDYYWDTSYKEEQKRVFRIQIEWSLEYQLPLMIHAREAHHDLVELVAHYKNESSLCGVFHCFTGTVEEALELLETFPRFVLGVGGVSTFRKSILPEVLPHIPIERIVLETDSPYMAPVPFRGKRNEPSFIPYIANKLAEIYGVSVGEVMETTTQTALRMFSKHINNDR